MTSGTFAARWRAHRYNRAKTDGADVARTCRPPGSCVGSDRGERPAWDRSVLEFGATALYGWTAAEALGKKSSPAAEHPISRAPPGDKNNHL